MDTPSVSTWHPGIVLPSSGLTPDIIAAIKVALSPAQTLALTAWAEGRSRLVPGAGWVATPLPAMANVINVCQNRAADKRWSRLGLKNVPLVRWAFSCWEPKGGPDINHDPLQLADNFETLMNRAQRLLAGEEPSDKLRDCLAVAEGCVAGAMVDSLFGSTHYYAEWMNPPPKWANGLTPVVTEYGHRFFVGVR